MKRGKKMSSGRRLISYMKPYWRPFALGILAMLIVAGANLLYANFIGFLTDLFSTSANAAKNSVTTSLPGFLKNFFIPSTGAKGSVPLAGLSLIVAGVFIITIIKGIFSFCQTYLTSYTGQKVIVDLRNEIFQHMADMPLEFHESHRTGEAIAMVTNDITLIQNSLSNGLVSLLYQVVFLVASLVLIFVLNWKLSLLTIIITPLVVWVVSIAGKRIRKISHRVQEKVADLSTIFHETLSGIRVVKAFTMEERLNKHFAAENDISFNANMKSVKALAMLTPTVEMLFSAALGLVIWYGGLEVLHGHLTSGQLIMFFVRIGMVGAPLTGLSNTYNSFLQALAAADRVFKILDYEPELKDAPNALTLPRVKGNVKFCDVSFGYREDIQVLSHINLEVKPGEIIALVGPSGGGKTSLVNLILRFYDPDKGRILIDDYDLREVKMQSLREQIGFVPQESLLFSASLRENIAYGRPGAAEAEIIAAAKAANAHEFIQSFPEGYDTIVGERGATLSGGQRQRIAVARALLRDPRILILDEATSALDTESERLVQEALERLMHDRTTFVIAHRLSTVQFAHKIVVISEGVIIEQGAHQELLAKNGLYKRLYDTGTEFKPEHAEENNAGET